MYDELTEVDIKKMEEEIHYRKVILAPELGAELKRTTPLSFACRCSQERAEAIVAALPEAERAALPKPATIVCHMCGHAFTVAV